MLNERFEVHNTRVGITQLASSGLEPIWNATELYYTAIDPLLLGTPLSTGSTCTKYTLRQLALEQSYCVSKIRYI